jgi:hypothetical protein
MRVKCPYCEKAYAVYPIPAAQAARHRRAGVFAWMATLGATALIFFLGADMIIGFVDALSRIAGLRLGMALAAASVTAPILFLCLAIYDRMVPHFGGPVGDDLHCLKCGYILKGLREPRCPQCGQPI